MITKKNTWRKKTTLEFIGEAVSIHYGLFTYDRSTYVSASTKIIITCRKHGDFDQTPSHHLSGQGCPECARVQQSSNRDKFIERSNLIHNNRFTYDKVDYKNSRTKVIITCGHHGDFEQTPRKHVHGQGCPKCCHRISIPETKWLDSLNIPTMIRQFPVKIQKDRKSIEVDGYDPTTNTVFLFHGDYYHGNPTVYNRTFINTRAKKTMGELFDRTMKIESSLKSIGYNVIVMWEFDWKNIERKKAHTMWAFVSH